METKRKLPKALKIVLIVVGGIVGLFIALAVVAAVVGGPPSSPAPEQTTAAPKQTIETKETPKATEKPKAEAVAKPKPAPVDVAQQIEDAAGVDGLVVEREGDTVFATFPLSDNFTENMIRTSGEDDTMKILKAVRDSGANFEWVFVDGTFPMQDQYGNTNDAATVVMLGYEAATVDKINFDTIGLQVWDLRDSGKVHAEFDGQ